MSYEYLTEKREFVRIQTDIPIRYKFLSKTVEIDDDQVYEGITTNLSGSGLLLLGKVPSVTWIPALLMEDIIIGLNLLLPALDHPIKMLGRVAWIEAFQKGTDRCALGIRFKDISKEHQDEVLKYIIKAQITR